ncbi:MAG: hypothetical protein JWN25_3475 [Verrucomicrobiales bacterium]|nr:hypothetical protein [Verrucomicrobiales bacterium]
MGTVPFVLGLLYFVADMSKSPLAPERCIRYSFLLTFLFVGMKFFHSIFAEKIRHALFKHETIPWSGRMLFTVLAHQALIGALGMPILLICAIITLPLGWAVAFFQSANVCPFNEQKNFSGIVHFARRHAFVAPRQNHAMLFIMSLFTIMVMVNVGLAFYALPYLGKVVFGIETAVSMNLLSLLNTTYLMAVGMITWMLVDPIVKVTYILRCFYGNSVTSGDDILSSLERMKSARLARAVLILICFCLFCLLPAQLQAANPSPRPASNEPQIELEKKISQVSKRREYQWRMPKDPNANRGIESKTWLGSFFDDLLSVIESIFQWVGNLIGKLARYFRPSSSPMVNSPTGAGSLGAKGLLALFSAIVVGFTVYFLCKLRLSRVRAVTVIPLTVTNPDLEDDSVTADQLPEDSWFSLAQELFDRGDNRKALRALFLGCLANLATRQLVLLARHKSNHDYQREVARRGKTHGQLPGQFASMVAVYDCVWYGQYQMSSEFLDQVKATALTIVQK